MAWFFRTGSPPGRRPHAHPRGNSRHRRTSTALPRAARARPTPRVADVLKPPTFACGAYGSWTSKPPGGVSQKQVAPDWGMNGTGGDRRGARGADGTAGDPQGACVSMRTSSPPVPLGSLGSNVLPARSASKGSGPAHAPAGRSGAIHSRVRRPAQRRSQAFRPAQERRYDSRQACAGNGQPCSNLFLGREPGMPWFARQVTRHALPGPAPDTSPHP